MRCDLSLRNCSSGNITILCHRNVCRSLGKPSTWTMTNEILKRTTKDYWTSTVPIMVHIFFHWGRSGSKSGRADQEQRFWIASKEDVKGRITNVKSWFELENPWKMTLLHMKPGVEERKKKLQCQYLLSLLDSISGSHFLIPANDCQTNDTNKRLLPRLDRRRGTSCGVRFTLQIFMSSTAVCS